jgi:predicted O-methyltransferase YrrM
VNGAGTDNGGDQVGWRSRLRAAVLALRGSAPAAEGKSPSPDQDVSIDLAIETLAAAPVREVQDHGYHFQPRDYYSALNDLPFLEENWDLWHERPLPPGIDWDIDAQLDEVRRIAPYLGELQDVPMAAPDGPPAYHWENDFWRGADAMVHYGLLRHVKPRRVVEIGAGWSSLLMADALDRNHEEGRALVEVDQIEPYPRTELLSALPPHWTLHEVILQRANLEIFDSLEAGDICFYDGSHVARAGSDVVWFFFEVLPRLKPGVLVHVHDIFWPADYPDEWIFERGQTWNEQYVLQAFLMYNNAFEPILCNSLLFHKKKQILEDLYRGTRETQYSGVSVWLRKTAFQPLPACP